RIHLQQGERALALKQFEACREILMRELGVEPDEETALLAKEARNNTAGGPDRAPAPPQQASVPGAAPTPASPARHPTQQRRLYRWAVGAIAAVFLLASTAMTGWFFWEQHSATPTQEGISIAVLPFKNLSGDPDQDYFADGVTEDLITDLSQLSGLLVIARNSTFKYKDRPVSPQQIGEELGVRYLLEGSMRRAAGRIRVNAKLIEAQSGHHLWAERFDRELTDVFALQDEVVEKIVTALKIEVTQREREQLDRRRETTPEAYDMFLRGQQKFLKFSQETNLEAREIFLRATKLDPGYARAWANAAITHLFAISVSWSSSPEESARIGKALALKALELDPTVREVHFTLGSAYLRERNFDKALATTTRSVELDPNFADGHAQLSWILNYMGRPAEGLSSINKAMRLHPHYSYFYEAILGQAYFHLARYEEAAAMLERAVERNPEFNFARQYLAATYSHMGRIDDAEWQISEIMAAVPDYSVEHQKQHSFYQHDSDLAHFLEGLRKAGLREYSQ
ncbi:MAG: hypothetical protein OEZ03_05625, partial [Alphaproteobacteria bacterium]|nr:hypothetical protein [Alphaproteobacteria bacterium]